jgi:acyl-CoA thioesterase-1
LSARTAFFLIATSCALAAAEGEPKANDNARRPRVVLVFGDSITAGGALPAAERDLLWLKVIERRSEGTLRMVNEGKGGRPTASLPDFEAALRRNPQVDQLVVALGTNDSRDLSQECVPKAVENLRKMIELARAAYGQELPVLLVGPPNLNKAALVATKPIGNEREARLRELGEAYALLAKELRCQFLSLFGSVPESSLTKDGVHPNGEGNAAIAQLIGDALRASRK